MPRLEKLVRLGITAVRDAGDKDGVGLALSKRYKSLSSCAEESRRMARELCGRIPGGEHAATGQPSALSFAPMPYLDSPGAAIHHKGRYGSFMGGALEDYASLADCVAARIAAGADRIKLIPTGIINFKLGAVTTEPQMTVEELRALVAAANAAGRQTFAHASGDAGIERVIESGVDSVEHGFFVRDDQLTRMRDRTDCLGPDLRASAAGRSGRPATAGMPRSSATCSGFSTTMRPACGKPMNWVCSSLPAAMPVRSASRMAPDFITSSS